MKPPLKLSFFFPCLKTSLPPTSFHGFFFGLRPTLHHNGLFNRFIFVQYPFLLTLSFPNNSLHNSRYSNSSLQHLSSSHVCTEIKERLQGISLLNFFPLFVVKKTSKKEFDQSYSSSASNTQYIAIANSEPLLLVHRLCYNLYGHCLRLSTNSVLIHFPFTVTPTYR